MAYSFDGSTDYLQVVSPIATSEPVTMCAWVNGPDTASNDRVVALTDGSAAAERIALGVQWQTTQDKARFNNNDGTTNVTADTTTQLTADTWHHLLGVEKGTSRDVYLDNGGIATESTSLTFTGNIDRLTIGAKENSSSFGGHFTGDIAEVAIWNVTDLSSAERQTLVNGFSPLFVRPQSLVFYAPLVRGVIDLIGGLSLTINGAVVSAHPRIIMPAPKVFSFPVAAAGGLSIPVALHHYNQQRCA